MLAGSLYTAVGLLRLGWITNFLSHSVIAGFMTGAAVIIGLSQVKGVVSSFSRSPVDACSVPAACPDKRKIMLKGSVVWSRTSRKP